MLIGGLLCAGLENTQQATAPVNVQDPLVSIQIPTRKWRVMRALPFRY